jgi:RNA polymerase sigma factor (sigma-70 family)
MRLVRTTESSLQTPESVFASKYPWLLRWALHFSQNNRAVAEDLVQDTFLKLLLSWESLHDLDNIEPLLYSYLKYSHLAEQRRGQRYSFQSLSTIDCDSLGVILSNARPDGQLELQDELRRIVNFLLWRKNSARFASIFLLRFFHGYFPDEIAQICCSSRHAVDLSLSHAREELRAYLLDSNNVEVIHMMRPEEIKPSGAAIPEHDFVGELRRSIFAAAGSPCLAIDELQARYQKTPQTSIESSLLAHIVSCKRCLDEVSNVLGLPPASGRTPDDSLGSAPRGKKTKKSFAPNKDGLERVLAGAQRKMREIQEHHPRALMLVLNGQVIAVRDINSHWAQLKVETHSIDTVDLIEVISDQGLPLLAYPLRQAPPFASPEQKHEVTLGAGRTIALLLRFTIDGALIEITYNDPSFSTESLNQQEEPAGVLGVNGITYPPHNSEVSAIQNIGPLHSWWRSIRNMWQSLQRHQILAPALIALVLLLASAVIWKNTSNKSSSIDSGDLLRNAVSADGALVRQGAIGIIHQAVEIRTPKRSLHRNIYRDIQGKRRRKSEQMTAQDQALKGRLEQAGVNWNDPLSATDFLTWHGRAARFHDVVTRTGNLLTLHTSSPDDVVEEESLTVRTTDFHPVMRNVQFRDRTVVEIAELEYEVLPWNASNELWFEPESTNLPARMPHLLPHLHIAGTAHLSESQMNEAELNALLTLKELHADTERLQVKTTPGGVEVSGIVQTQERKDQISSQLRRIAYVTPLILSYGDLDGHPSSATDANNIASISVTSESSLLDKHLEGLGWERGNIATLSDNLLRSSTSIYRESKAFEDLMSRFSNPSLLTPSANAALHTLLLQHLNTLTQSIDEQEHSLTAIAVSPPSTPTAITDNETNILNLAQQNLTLSKELLYSSTEQSRTVSTILIDLAASTKNLRDRITKLQTSPLLSSIPSPIISPPRH